MSEGSWYSGEVIRFQSITLRRALAPGRGLTAMRPAPCSASVVMSISSGKRSG